MKHRDNKHKHKKEELFLIPIFFLLVFCPNLAYRDPDNLYLNNPTTSNGGTYVPEGIIAMWSGSLASIPEGWILCDGNQFTPNTTGRFVFNTDGIENAGTIGGSDDHSHSYNTVPLHNHGSTGVTQSTHNHLFNAPAGPLIACRVDGVTMPAILGSSGTGGASGDHTHSTTQTGVTTGYTSEVSDLSPPYYKLAFIKKVTDNSTIPAGIIMIWAGFMQSIPQGWAVCNGTQGTPDLEARFVMGVSTEDPGAVGGNYTHSHTYTAIPQHSHTTSSNGASHSHPAVCSTTLLAWQSFFGAEVGYPIMDYTEYTDVFHTHTMNTVGQAVCTTEDADHLPPYSTVAYIMNIQDSEGIPTGSVGLWADTVANIPIGWDQCDGTDETPDLRERFLLGSSLPEPIGTIGGTLSHKHVYTEIPLHTHSIQTGNLRHRHQLYENNQHYTFPNLVAPGGTSVYGINTANAYTANSDAPHSHNVLPTGAASPNTQTKSNLPPYIELTFIQQQRPITQIVWLSPEEEITILLPRAPTVEFNFDYLWIGMGNEITLTFSNGTDNFDAGSVMGLDSIFMDYLSGDVTAVLHLWQDATELTYTTRSFTFINNRIPTVEVIQPNGGENISGEYDIQWSGSDPDGDQLYYTVEYNVENTGWVTIKTDWTGTSCSWNTTLVLNSDSVEIRVTASDRFGGQILDKSDDVFEIHNQEDDGNDGIIPDDINDIPGFNVIALISTLILTGFLISRKLRRKL